VEPPSQKWLGYQGVGKVEMKNSRGVLCGFLAVLLLFAAACSRDPNVRKQKYFESGNRYFEQEKYREAVIQYLNAIQVDPRYAQAHYRLAQCYEKLGIWNGAYQELLRTVDLEPENLAAQVEVGNLLLAAREFQQAQERAELVLKKDPKNVDAHILLANSYAALQDLPASLREMQAAIELAPERPRSYLNLAFLQIGSKQAAAAEESFKKAVQLDPKSMEAHLALGNFYQVQRRWAEAEGEYRRGIELSPKNPLPRRALTVLYLAQGKTGEAEQVVAQAKKDLGDNPEAYRMLGDFYFSRNQLDKALAEYASLNREHPADLRVKKNYIQLLILQEKLDDATKLNDEILKANANDVDGLIYRGQILNRQGRPADAVPAFEAALKTEPDNALAHYHLGIAFNASGKLEQAESEWREAVRLRPPMVAAQQALANVAIRKNDFDLLARTAEQILKDDPQSANAYLLRATAHLGQRDAKGAEEDLKSAMRIAPDDPRPYTQLGVLRVSERKVGEAEKLFEQALQKNPGFVDALQGLFVIYAQQKQPAKAVARAEAQVAKAPKSSALEFALAQAWLLDSKPDHAEAALEKAVALDPKNAEALLTLAQLEAQRGSPEKAIANYQRGIQNNPRDVRNYLLYGALEDYRGNWQKAQELYQKALQVQPGNAVAANNLAYLLLEHGGNVDVAVSYAQGARTALPDQPFTADTLAWAYYQKGAYALAIGLLEEALKKTPQNPTYHYHLGLAYQKLNDKARAKAHLSRALELNPNYAKASDIRKALAELGGD